MKGQNFRILRLNASSKWECIGMATNCTITLTNNTENVNTKDDVALADKPSVTTHGWSVQVESLSVADVATMLTAIKNKTQFRLLWDATDTSDNQTGEQEGYARYGDAYLNDATFTFNDRENATKSLQFTGNGALGTLTTTPTYQAVSAGALTKGQFVRLYLGSDNTATPAKVIAAAKQLSLHVSVSLEEATTKDTTGSWVVNEPQSLTYDIQTRQLVASAEVITSSVAAQGLSDLESIYEGADPVKWCIANASGANNRTKGSVICSGSVTLTQLTINAPNRQNADYTARLSGYGMYNIGA